MTRADETRVSSYPTRYRGIRFRSRLEATWAAFFSELRWPWQYEPLDLADYIPDFVLQFKEPLLVEVKPLWSFEELIEARDVQKRIERSGWTGEALLVGIAPFPPRSWDPFNGKGLGVLAERWDDEDDVDVWAWDEGMLFGCMECHQYSILHTVQSYRCRVSECHEGGHHVDTIAPSVWDLIWAEAKNAVQWQPDPAKLRR